MINQAERTLISNLVGNAKLLPRSIAKLLTAPAHRAGWMAPDTLPPKIGKLSSVELRALSQQCRDLVHAASGKKEMPAKTMDSYIRIAQRLNYEAWLQEGRV